jgi:cardiolipin synthase A/B
VIDQPSPRSAPSRLLADQALSRTAGAPLIGGNAVRLLKDAAENFPAWLDAIGRAERSIGFESYIVGNDATGREFRDALAARARAGVHVCVLYDWLGSPGKLIPGFWRPATAAGVVVRAFNRPRFASPLGWLSRDHRKSIVVDGRVAFVSGLCVTDAWVGSKASGKDPWRDTGIEIRGPGVADVERAFAQVWTASGGSLSDLAIAVPAQAAPAGDVSLRIVATSPAEGGLMRLDQLIASIARRRLWLTDAYFVPVTAYVQALSAAARDGVDVRLLVPGASDIPLVSPLSRSAYRSLLDAGVRVFEWNGAMLHAKTAVADGRWARVGSSNLNLASFVGNYELDVAVEDAGFAAGMERQYLEDLEGATEILLKPRRWRRPAIVGPESGRRRAPSGSAGRAAAGAVRFGSTVGTALVYPGALAYGSGRMMTAAGLILIGLAAAAVLWPKLIAWPLAAVAVWFALALLMRASRGAD